MVAALDDLGADMHFFVVVDICGDKSKCSTDSLMSRIGVLRLNVFCLWTQNEHRFDEKPVDDSVVIDDLN